MVGSLFGVLQRRRQSSTIVRAWWFWSAVFMCIQILFSTGNTTSTNIPETVSVPSTFDSLSKTTITFPCGHGQLVNNTCVCDTGWAGSTCSVCGGRVLLTDLQGTLLTGNVNQAYSNNSKCVWLVEAPYSNVPIAFKLVNFTLECAYDYLSIYDGDSMYSYKLAVLSGTILKEEAKPDSIVARSGSAYVVFQTDADIQYGNIRIDYLVNATFDQGRNVSQDQSNSAAEAQFVQYSNLGPTPSGRVGSQLVAISRNTSVYQLLIGGYQPPQNLANVYDYPNVDPSFGGSLFTEFALQLNSSGNWLPLETSSDTNLPTQLFGHSATYADISDSVYVFGGFLDDQLTLNDYLYIYHFANRTWSIESVRVSGAQPVAYHSAHVVAAGSSNVSLYVFFGYSPTYGYSNLMQVYSVESRSWSIVTLFADSSAPAPGGLAMHTSMYDPSDQRFYFFGGVTPSAGGDMTNSLFSVKFSADGEAHVDILSPAPSALYQSPGVLHGSLLLFFLGKRQHDFDQSTQLVNSTCQDYSCIAQSLLVYDTACDRWFSIDCVSLKPRFGSAVSYELGPDGNAVVHIFGGSNFGALLNDFYQFDFGDCSTFTSASSCASALFVTAQRCVWYASTNSCVVQTLWLSQNSSNTVCSAYDPQPNADSSTDSNSTNSATINRETAIQCSSFVMCTHCVLQPACGWFTAMVACGTGQCPVASACLDISSVNSSTPSTLIATVNATEFVLQRELTCPRTCSSYSSCSDCTQTSNEGVCVWCESTRTCVNLTASRVALAYDQCSLLSSSSQDCSAVTCTAQLTCAACQQLPHCGWCSEPADNGLGVCLPGGYSKPFTQLVSFLVPSLTPPLSSFASYCLAQRSLWNQSTNSTALSTLTGSDWSWSKTWNFFSCPLCQCNGHSTCVANTSICVNCSGYTTGKQCESCITGFYGNALDGGVCTPCQCSYLAASNICDSKSGQCTCATKGVVGMNCDQCEASNGFVSAMPAKNQTGNCYYPLLGGYLYTFPLLRTTDESITAINFLNLPPSDYTFLAFSVSANSQFQFSVTYASNSQNEKVVVPFGAPVMTYSDRFDPAAFPFDPSSNCTFYVYLTNFTTPTVITVSFSQAPVTSGLLLFFMVFTGCFMVILLLAMIVYKIKQRFDAHRRRRNAKKERAYMAKRPYSRVHLIFPTGLDLQTGYRQLQTFGGNSNRPSPSHQSEANIPVVSSHCPLSVMPMVGSRGGQIGIFSSVIVLPGDPNTMPSGTHVLALGNALTSIDSKRHSDAISQWSRKVSELRAAKKKKMEEAESSELAGGAQAEPSSVNTVSTQNLSYDTTEATDSSAIRDRDSAALGVDEGDTESSVANGHAHVNVGLDVTELPDVPDSSTAVVFSHLNFESPAAADQRSSSPFAEAYSNTELPLSSFHRNDVGVDDCTNMSGLTVVSGASDTPVYQTFL